MTCKCDLFSTLGSKLLKSVKNRALEEAFPNDKSNISYEFSDISGMGCLVCRHTFDSYAKWRLHYKSRLHRENLKRKLKGKLPLQDISEDAETSSEDSTSSEVEESEIQQPTESLYLSSDEMRELKFSNEEFFVTEENEVMSVKRCLLPLSNYKTDEEPMTTVATLEFIRGLSNKSTIVVMMLSSGRFAGCVFNKSTPVIHKTFVRYTVRAKQGGGQSSRDSQQGGSHPKSAGAALRRYNEKALAEDIEQLLVTWKEYIKAADYIFLRCSKPHRWIFFDTDSKVLCKTDPKLRNIPFTTYKPSFEEVCRVHKLIVAISTYGNLDEFKKLFELTKTQTLFVDDSVKQIAKVVDELNDKDDVVVKAEAKTNRKKGKGPKTEVIMNQEKEQLTEPTLPEALRREIFTACRAGNAEELRNVYDINVAGGNEELQLGFLSYLNSSVTGENSPTLLHLAAFNSHRSLVRLLLELGADPTVKANSQQFKISQPMVPYQLCPERPLRQVFVEFRRANPDLWDWKAAQIPEPSDPHDDSKRQEKLAERRKKDRDAKKKREKERKEADKEAEAERIERERFLALSDREKRALAAERRILALCAETRDQLSVLPPPVLKRCFNCASDLTGKVPFEYGTNVFCSMSCLKVHRNKPT